MSFILQAGIFMGFAITSAVCGGIIIIMYGTTLGTAVNGIVILLIVMDIAIIMLPYGQNSSPDTHTKPNWDLLL